MASVKILVADDHDLMRRGLRTVLEAQPGWQVCAEAHSGKEAVEKAEETQPDVAILDISMPGLDGLQAARQIREASSKTEILALSMHCSDQLIRDVIEAGMRGYVTKSDSDRDLIGAVKALANHRPFFTSQATQLMLTLNTGHSVRAGQADGVKERLTAREREIVCLISEGKSSREVAEMLGISVKTAETHRANVMRKLQVHTVSELVRYALRNRLLEA